MNKTSVSFLCLIVLFLYNSCTQVDRTIENDSDEIVLIKTDSFVLENTQPMFGRFIETFYVNKTGDILVFNDRLQNKLFTFNNAGKFLNTIGERGRGPKGILEVYQFAIDDENRVYIYDSAQYLLKIFDLDGELIHSKEFFLEGIEPTHYELHLYNGKIFTPIIELEYSINPEKSKMLGVFDIDGKVDSLFGFLDPFSSKANSYDYITKITIDKNEKRMYSNLRTSPYIQVYDLENFQKLDYFGIKSKNFKLPDKHITRQMPLDLKLKYWAGTSSVYRIYTTNDYVIQHMQILTKDFLDLGDYNQKENYLVIYDKYTYEFVTEIPVQSTLGAVQENKLYFVENFDPDSYTIAIYEISNAK